MSGLGRPPWKEVPVDDETIAGIESALHTLARRLKQARLHDFVLKQAGLMGLPEGATTDDDLTDSQ